MKTLRQLLLLFPLATVLCGCSSLRGLTSTPPVKALVLEAPTELTFSMVGSKASLPAGEYKPILEDNRGYYYMAPTKIAFRDLGSYMHDGGLIVLRGQNVPTEWYFIHNNGSVVRLKLPAGFPVKVVE